MNSTGNVNVIDQSRAKMLQPIGLIAILQKMTVNDSIMRSRLDFIYVPGNVGSGDGASNQFVFSCLLC